MQPDAFKPEQIVTPREMQRSLSGLLDRLQAHGSLLVVHHSKPVAVLSALSPPVEGPACDCDNGEIVTGECEYAMSGPTCTNANCPPCQTPERIPCPDCTGRCGGTGYIRGEDPPPPGFSTPVPVSIPCEGCADCTCPRCGGPLTIETGPAGATYSAPCDCTEKPGEEGAGRQSLCVEVSEEQTEAIRAELCKDCPDRVNSSAGGTLQSTAVHITDEDRSHLRSIATILGDEEHWNIAGVAVDVWLRDFAGRSALPRADEKRAALENSQGSGSDKSSSSLTSVRGEQA